MKHVLALPTARGWLLTMSLLIVLAAVPDSVNSQQEVDRGERTEAVQPETGHGHALPAGYMVLPFVVLLLMIATGPLFYKHFWEHHFQKVSVALGLVTVLYYMIGLKDTASLTHTLAEYISFISLLTALFVASGGILITIDRKATPMFNSMLLFVGSIIANLIGTTGASMLLIRPFLRVNKGRIKPYHVVFFIFTISNVAGALTPIGDPPLFLGFLKGVPFFWVIEHVVHIWLLALILILAVFYYFDSRNKSEGTSQEVYTGKFTIRGQKNFLYLFLVILAVFMDPNVISGFPDLHGAFHVPFGIREIVMLVIAFLAYKTADREALRGNEFNFAPIKEVAWLFVGIFATMIPALQLVQHQAGQPEVARILTPGMFYWATGTLSSFLDNAPTYLSFLSAAVGKFSIPGGMDALKDFYALEDSGFVGGTVSWMFGIFHVTQFEEYLLAISIGAVFFGANTYIGNGPNFMVKSIAEQSGIECPSFFGYMIKYSIPILIPIYALVWLLFFVS
jgi:Na+/H+ antiporter NhaD/arsenite permease-like protein